MPQAIILAGPNGAGKSTSKPRLIDSSIAFLNADDIARDMGGEASPRRDLAAGRLLLSRLAEFEKSRADFAIETNLANRTLALRMPKWQAAGYHVSLFFVWVPSDELSVSRVALRVASGGHNIPEETIRRRYTAGLQNLFNVYIPIVDAWRVYDNSSEDSPSLVASGEQKLLRPERWADIRKTAVKSQEGDGT